MGRELRPDTAGVRAAEGSSRGFPGRGKGELVHIRRRASPTQVSVALVRFRGRGGKQLRSRRVGEPCLHACTLLSSPGEATPGPECAAVEGSSPTQWPGGLTWC